MFLLYGVALEAHQQNTQVLSHCCKVFLRNFNT
ncbi:hypothetical protein [Providencia hangzhouensis]